MRGGTGGGRRSAGSTMRGGTGGGSGPRSRGTLSPDAECRTSTDPQTALRLAGAGLHAAVDEGQGASINLQGGEGKWLWGWETHAHAKHQLVPSHPPPPWPIAKSHSRPGPALSGTASERGVIRSGISFSSILDSPLQKERERGGGGVSHIVGAQRTGQNVTCSGHHWLLPIANTCEMELCVDVKSSSETQWVGSFETPKEEGYSEKRREERFICN